MLGETSVRMSIETVRKLHTLAERRRRHLRRALSQRALAPLLHRGSVLLRMARRHPERRKLDDILERMTASRDEAKAA
jgi:hypothetical protein